MSALERLCRAVLKALRLRIPDIRQWLRRWCLNRKGVFVLFAGGGIIILPVLFVLVAFLPLSLTSFCGAVSESKLLVVVLLASNLGGERSKFFNLFSSQYPEDNNVFISFFESFV